MLKTILKYCLLLGLALAPYELLAQAPLGIYTDKLVLMNDDTLILNRRHGDWWFGLTGRLDDDRFLRLVAQRAGQGFTAAQIVVGIPPEVGPAHPSARSPVGPAWDLHGTPNEAYLRMAQARIDVMNRHGLAAIVYGGWGPQIDWIGDARMTAWWRSSSSSSERRTCPPPGVNFAAFCRRLPTVCESRAASASTQSGRSTRRTSSSTPAFENSVRWSSAVRWRRPATSSCGSR
jgi:hypothetical protein